MVQQEVQVVPAIYMEYLNDRGRGAENVVYDIIKPYKRQYWGQMENKISRIAALYCWLSADLIIAGYTL